MRARFWGTRGSIPTPGQRTVRYGGNTACVEVRDGGDAILVLDAGTGLRELGLYLAQEADGPLSLEMFLSHLHWDHIQGIPFFRPAYDPRTSLRIRAPRHAHPVKELLGMGMDDPFFPVDLDALPAKIDIEEIPDGAERGAGPFRVRSALLHHPAPTLAYRVEADGRSLVYATDTEDPFSGKDNPVIALASGADCLIHDAQYEDDDYKKGWGHSTIASAVDVAARAGVRRLVLYHHDPDRSDDALDEVGKRAQKLARERAGALEVLVAYEGMELAI
ncbi:MAG: MBL fold metallo-hydrolase [Chloroflexota bacterium]|nr:MBL fold metallo-hydrolase [Chloroflexota bacterium]